MYKNSKQTVLFPMLLAAGVALGILWDSISADTIGPPRSGAC